MTCPGAEQLVYLVQHDIHQWCENNQEEPEQLWKVNITDVRRRVSKDVMVFVRTLTHSFLHYLNKYF